MKINDVRKSSNGLFFKILEKFSDDTYLFLVNDKKYKIYMKAPGDKIKKHSKKVRLVKNK